MMIDMLNYYNIDIIEIQFAWRSVMIMIALGIPVDCDEVEDDLCTWT